MKIIIRNNKTGKHYKIEMGGKVKVGDKIMRINDKEYLYNGRFEYCEVFKILEAKNKKKKNLDPFIEKRRPKSGLRGINSKGAIFSELVSMPLNWVVPEYTKPLLNIYKPGRWIVSTPRYAGQNFVNKQIQKKKLKELHKRPYFKTTVEEVKGKPRGEENLDKIKFPCWCSYKCNGFVWVGALDRDFKYYYLNSMNAQKDFNTVDKKTILKDLMDRYDIEILKGELKLWKEVGEYTKRKE